LASSIGGFQASNLPDHGLICSRDFSALAGRSASQTTKPREKDTTKVSVASKWAVSSLNPNSQDKNKENVFMKNVSAKITDIFFQMGKFLSI
jgi:hypothetical protein